jgi:hypothetical protein
MRKYRGLTKEGKWVYGWYTEVMNHHFIIPNEATWGLDLDLNEKTIARQIEVIPETVGQSTGLKDKSGKEEVYEGDLMKDSLHIYKVTWDEKNARWLLIDIKEPKNQFKGHAITLLTKVGNHHQNPSLLEKP